MDHSIKPTGRRLATIRQCASTPGYGVFTESALRHLIFGSEERLNSKGEAVKGNGFGRVVIRIGRKVFLDLDEFDNWLEAHRVQPVTGGD